jgi:ribosomal protein L11 methyltransferase
LEVAGMAASRKRVDWKTEWMRYLVPVRISPGFWLAPEGSEVHGDGRVIRYRPALAFGDGGHATTRLASRELERLCASGRFREVFDVGSGTGVLAFVALLSGVERAVGTDVWPEALLAARENAELNGLAQRFSVCEPKELAARAFELIVANLEAPVLLENATLIASYSAPGTRLLVTGFLDERREEVRARFAGLGFSEQSALSEEGWSLLELEFGAVAR